MNNQLKTLSKYLSLVLRHQPDEIDIELDENGWARVDELIEKINQKGIKIDLTILKTIVETNNKKRFAFNENGDKIRASQGHSISIDLGYTPQKPPSVLFHGTAQQNVESILKNGIEKRSRQHVHLSADVDTALKVGQRHGKPIILQINSASMFEQNHSFFISENGVWLTDFVPSKYILKINE